MPFPNSPACQFVDLLSEGPDVLRSLQGEFRPFALRFRGGLEYSCQYDITVHSAESQCPMAFFSSLPVSVSFRSKHSFGSKMKQATP